MVMKLVPGARGPKQCHEVGQAEHLPQVFCSLDGEALLLTSLCPDMFGGVWEALKTQEKEPQVPDCTPGDLKILLKCHIGS